MVHPVDEVDVSDPWWTKKHLGPLRSPFRRMAGLILWPDIGLDLNDFTHEGTTIDHSYKILADERPSYRQRWDD